MKKNYLTILACLLLAIPALAQDDATTEKKDESQIAQMSDEEKARNQELQTTAHAIQETFGYYRQAIADQDSSEVATMVTQETVDYFKELQELALYATPDELEKKGLTDRMQVVVLRHRVPMSTLQKKDHVELLKFCVETGLLGKSIAAVEIGEIRLKENEAEAQTVLNGQPLPVVLRFAKEGETWKVDMLSILSAGNEMLRGVAEERGLTEDDLILQMVTKGSGMDVPKDIWQPPLTRDGASAVKASSDS